jgi:hypothetical protein
MHIKIWVIHLSSNDNSSFFISTLPRIPKSVSGAHDTWRFETKKTRYVEWEMKELDLIYAYVY